MTPNPFNELEVELHKPEEPLSLKHEIQSQLPDDGEPANWDIESLAVWYGNRIQSYLWDEWKDTLKPYGFDWPSFLKLMSRCTNYFTLWIADEKGWEEVISDIQRTTNEWGSLILKSQ